MANLPNTGKRLGTRRPRCIEPARPEGQIPAGWNRLRCPRIIRHRCKAGRRDPCRGSCGPLQKKTLRTLALMPLNIGIAMVGCDPNLSVTSCTGFPCPWRMRRVCSLAIGTPFPWRAARGLKRRVPWAGNVNDTVAPHGRFGPAAIFCGIGRFQLRGQRSGEYRQAGQRRQDRRKVSGGAELERAIMGLPGRAVETRRDAAGWIKLAKRAIR